MTSTSIIYSQQREALEEIFALCTEIDPKAAARLTRYTPGGTLPNTVKSRPEFDLLLLEAMLILAKAHAKAQKPRPRGRPRKDAAQQTH
jgi:hypothetical protein